MAKGWQVVENEAQRQAERRKEIDEQRSRQGTQLFSSSIKQAPDMAIIVRLLEQGNEGPNAVNSFARHEYKKPDKKYPDRFTCLKEKDPNADCPGCNAGLKIVVRGVYNMIQRNRPIFRKDANNKPLQDAAGQKIVDGFADEVVYWECSNTTANLFRRRDNEYHGLMSRDLRITATGQDTNPYDLTPADIDSGPQPMSEADLALAAKKHDLDEIYKPPTLQEAASIVARYGANSGANSTAQGIPNAVRGVQDNPMMENTHLPPGAAISGAFAAAQQPPKQ
jgi:hypothetical protein